MKNIFELFNHGGPVFTYTIVGLTLLIISLFIRALLQKDFNKKSRSIIGSVGWLALAWGYLGRTFGLIVAFDNIAAAGEIAPRHLAGGLKMAIIGPLLGIIAFLTARLVILILQMKSKKESFD